MAPLYSLELGPLLHGTYELIRYGDNETLGHFDLTDAQHAHYLEISQQPQGLIRLGDLPHDLYALEPEHQGTSENTTVWIS